MRSVLFIGLTDYDLSKDDPILREKMEGLSRDMRVYVLARGRGGHHEQYGVHFYLIPKFFGRLGVFVWALGAFFWGLALIMRGDVRVIVSQSPAVEGFIATLLSKLTGRKLVIEVHGDWINGPFYYHRVPLERTVRSMLRGLGRFTLRRADTVRVISEFTREMVRELAPDARIVTFIAFTPVDQYLAATDTSWNPTVVFIGSLYRVKGVDILIKACLKLQTERPDMRLEILGDGPMRNELEELAAPLRDRVRFHGFVPIVPILKDAGVLVLPSRSEGLGRVLVEAAALGKPLIGSNVGGIPEVIRSGENGFLVPPEDVDALADAIRRVLADPEDAKRMGEKSRELARQEFSTERFFTGYRDMIAAL